MKVCAGASSGGHMNQLIRLLNHSGSWPKQPDFFVTTIDAQAPMLNQRGLVHVIGECNRNHPFLAIRTFLRCFKIALIERPDVIITTGSMPLALLCMCSKIFGARIVWIDSIANIESFSMSGKFVRLFADLFITQWPELAVNDSKVEYFGAIL